MNEIVLAAVGSALYGHEVLAYVIFFVGLALMVLEIFMPGVVVGLVGLAGVALGITLAFNSSVVAGVVLLAVAVVSLPVLVVVWLKVVGPAMAHQGEVQDDQEARGSQHALLGQEGVALTTLRPSGVAQLGGRRVDVVTDGEIVDQNARVKAVEIRGNQVVVRAVRL